MRMGAVEKVRIAARLRAETAVPLKWVAQELKTGSIANVAERLAGNQEKQGKVKNRGTDPFTRRSPSTPTIAVLTKMRYSFDDTERGKCGALVAAVFIMTFLFGCGGDPYAGKYAKTKPNQQSFVGDWLLKKNPVGGTPAKAPTVTFGPDGSFKATEYPGIALDEFSHGKSFVDGGGTWAIEQHQNFWVLRIHWQVIDGVQQDYGDMLHILNNRPPYVLHHIIGDPDSGEALVFEKTK